MYGSVARYFCISGLISLVAPPPVAAAAADPADGVCGATPRAGAGFASIRRKVRVARCILIAVVIVKTIPQHKPSASFPSAMNANRQPLSSLNVGHDLAQAPNPS